MNRADTLKPDRVLSLECTVVCNRRNPHRAVNSTGLLHQSLAASNSCNADSTSLSELGKVVLKRELGKTNGRKYADGLLGASCKGSWLLAIQGVLGLLC